MNATTIFKLMLSEVHKLLCLYVTEPILSYGLKDVFSVEANIPKINIDG